MELEQISLIYFIDCNYTSFFPIDQNIDFSQFKSHRFLFKNSEKSLIFGVEATQHL